MHLKLFAVAPTVVAAPPADLLIRDRRDVNPPEMLNQPFPNTKLCAQQTHRCVFSVDIVYFCTKDLCYYCTCVQVLSVACEACQQSIEGSKGKMVVKEAARAVSERDDRLLAEKMEALEAANREVSLGGVGGHPQGMAMYWLVSCRTMSANKANQTMASCNAIAVRG